MRLETFGGFVAALLLAIGTSSATTGAPHPSLGCRGNPHLKGRCYWVRGVLGMTFDSGMAVMRDDNDVWLIERPAPGSRGDWPANLDRAMDKARHDFGDPDQHLHGEFQVCPIPYVPDFFAADQKYVCLQAARHIKRVGPPLDDSGPEEGSR